MDGLGMGNASAAAGPGEGPVPDGYVRDVDDTLVHYVDGVAFDRFPADGRIAFLVEEFDHWHDRVHRHGTPDFVRGQELSLLRRAKGLSPVRLHVMEVEVSALDSDALADINAHMAGKGEGPIRERLAGLSGGPRP